MFHPKEGDTRGWAEFGTAGGWGSGGWREGGIPGAGSSNCQEEGKCGSSSVKTGSLFGHILGNQERKTENLGWKQLCSPLKKTENFLVNVTEDRQLPLSVFE